MEGRTAVGVVFAVEIFVGLKTRIARVAELARFFVRRIVGWIWRCAAA
jgi:hypothetical protein